MEKSRHSLFELGCGLGVPGMIASVRGATTVLSEQERLLDQLRRNIHCDCVFEPLYGKAFTKLVYEDRANNIQRYESGNTK